MVKLKEMIHEIVVSVRRIERLVMSRKFSRIWTTLSEADQKEFMAYFKGPDEGKILKFIATKCPIEQLTMVELKALAAKYQIPNYSRLTKLTLMLQIAKEESRE